MRYFVYFTIYTYILTMSESKLENVESHNALQKLSIQMTLGGSEYP